MCFGRTRFCAAAIYSGKNTLYWLYENGCPWDGRVFVGVLIHPYPDVTEQLLVLNWLHENGCPWDEQKFIISFSVSAEVHGWISERGHMSDYLSSKMTIIDTCVSEHK